MGVKEALSSIMQQEIDENRAVGSYLLIYKGEEEIFRGAFGKDNTVDDKPIKDDSIYKMFSMTKPITSLATMICLERKLFSLDDKVSMYLPGFLNPKVVNDDGSLTPASREVLIKDLLSMTAGLEYSNDFSVAGKILGEKLIWPMEAGYPEKMIPTVELMNKVGELPLAFNPGERWNYSFCADVLGAIIEVVSNMSYGEFLEKNIFEPLGMVDTGFYVPEEKYDRLVTMHDFHDGKYVPWDYPFLGTQSRRIKPLFESGGAGLTSTPDDYAKFALCLAFEGTLPAKFSKTGKPVTLISKETAKFMRTGALSREQMDELNWDSLQGYNYGNLMRVLDNPEKAYLNGPAVGEFGWDGWAGTYVSIDPVNKITFMYFINITNGNREWQMKALKNALYKELL